ncbi:MAG TPA: hypothetical protein VFO89_01870 [Thermoanaerobaculia bacterium]|nr:hypothetical protein [Thermoanaerobaculia bacterium]
MPSAYFDPLPAADRDLLKRLGVVFAALFVLTAAFSFLVRTYSQKFYDVTGEARWIWARHPMSANEPVAFFAAKDVELPEQRLFTHVKVLGDPEYTLYVNGQKIAGQRVGEGRKIHVYDVSDLVKTGRNRVVVAVRAPQGFGGLIAAVDIAPETRNWVVTDASWRIYRRWDPLLLERDLSAGWEPPFVVGEPPVGRWNFLDLDERERAAPVQEVQPAREIFAVDGFEPRNPTRGGMAVATADARKATAFDFGFTRGRLRVTVNRDRPFSRAVLLRYANAREELPLIEWNLRAVVLAPGERVVEVPETNENFRYVMAFADDVTVEVIR